MRRVEIKRFASQFFIREDNPNGTIEAFKDDMPKDTMVPMMDLYLSQGKFGADPFNLRPQDKMAAMEKKLEELMAKYEGPKANPATEVYKPPVAVVEAPSVPLDDPAPDLTEMNHELAKHFKQDTSLEDMPWRDLVSKAKGMGLKPFHKTRTVVISEIEAKEAE